VRAQSEPRASARSAGGREPSLLALKSNGPQHAETRDSGQVRRVALFIAATYNGEAFPFDLFELRAVDEAISDDMLLCIDELRWGQSDLRSRVPDGDRRRIWGGKGGHRPLGPEVARGALTAGHLGD